MSFLKFRPLLTYLLLLPWLIWRPPTPPRLDHVSCIQGTLFLFTGTKEHVNPVKILEKNLVFFPLPLSPWVLCTQSSSLGKLAAMTLECKLIKLRLYLVLGKADFSMSGLVCVALLYIILVTRDTRRDFM